ncbi:MAG: glycosyl hydrolase, partial [Pseudomonadota bacterium]|nr:glycosyl hydrolase [Pseudomonadota bacterium]
MIDRKQRIALACAGLAFFSVNTVAEVQTATLEKATLNIDTDTNDFTISALHDSGFQVTYLTDDNGTPYANLPSMALPEPALTDVTNKEANDVELVETATTLILKLNNIAAHVDKATHVISYSVNGKVVAKEQDGLNISDNGVSLSFALDENEKLYGGGQRVLGMDRRGHSMPLYNKAHYGYTTSSNQMYFGLSAVMSSKNYSVLFDNTASGELDIGKTNSDELLFKAQGGRASYIMVLGENLEDTVT